MTDDVDLGELGKKCPRELELAIYAVGHWASIMNVPYDSWKLTELEDDVAKAIRTRALSAKQVVDCWLLKLANRIDQAAWRIDDLVSYVGRAMNGERIER